MNPDVLYIQKQVKKLYASLSPAIQDGLADCNVSFLAHIRSGQFKAAYEDARVIYKFAKKPETELNTLFHNLLFAEDVITPDSVVFIHKESPYRSSLQVLGREVGFSVQEHEFTNSYWTKDYMISTGKEVVVPVKDSRTNYFTAGFMNQAKANRSLYYAPLQMDEHHRAKSNISSPSQWQAEELLAHSTFARKSVLEGGNFFCAINEQKERYHIVGENAISETMAYNNVDREQAIIYLAKDLSCSVEQILPIPQWTYHLDLQMAYLGKGQFIIHSFDQDKIDFGLSDVEIDGIRKTFEVLKDLFEINIIEATREILEKHGFEVTKVFGCLFYLTDETDPEQLKYVPYCKSSEGFDGALALMMNGIALDLGEKGRHFITARQDLPLFSEQFASSLRDLGVTRVHGADMLEAYDYSGDFLSTLLGIQGACNVSQVAAYMNGALRCQTSIVSKTQSTAFHPDVSKHRFFKHVESYDLAETETSEHPVECATSTSQFRNQ
ncbi:hypothetical protein [Legionella shakespearei]|uniref:Uncharacterized protein n=1 Tax=Legionella shakespearei DSM 23087 TaxID=1122169 RepID=A0A0W0YKM7_9GAMM|nr:hypothetical protein [Legionella shakespearei]KTD57268.1 hypothetical protein Lsha_2650 [Legionella shakespearei DSM 23087]